MSIQVPPLRHGLFPTQASCSENQIITCHVTDGVVDRGVVSGVVSGVVEENAFLTVDNIVDVVEEMVNIGVYTWIFGQSASNTE